MLKKYFGHETFRAGQRQTVDNLLAGRDVLCVMPTGAGKSVCYQIPALISDGITIVISPLISLMKDQVSALKQAGIDASFINSSLSSEEYSEALRHAASGKCKLIYVAPERLNAPRFLEMCSAVKISFVAIDEAHCVSQWGQDFRPSYLKINEFIASLPYRPTLGAFTATATLQVKEDIKAILKLNDPFCLTTGFDRPNLYFSVKEARGKEKDKILLDIMSRHKEESGIIYCATRKNVEQVCELLIKNGYSATRYHAGLADNERRKNQEDFIYDRKPLIAATNAFGMGIDKSNVLFVVHYNMPKSIESYYQEAGRAGRDGSRAECILLNSPMDIRTNRFLIENSQDNSELSPEERDEVRSKELEKLKSMIFYCTTTKCLRSFILEYFGEVTQDKCGNCGNCEAEVSTSDITIDAQKILSCIARTGQRYGISLITAVLKGSKNERIERLGLYTQSTYGIMKDKTAAQIHAMINSLLSEEALVQTSGEYPILKLNEKSVDIMTNKVQIEMKSIALAEESRKQKKKAETSPVDESLYGRLKQLRLRLASENHVPAYIVFSDAALADMCRKLPRNREEFLEVSGVGAVKSEKYGDMFLEVINDR